ncbi:MAG: pseudouridine synthase [Bradymonadia bacterium]
MGIYHELHAVDAPAALAVVERIDGRVAVLGAAGLPELQQPHHARARVPAAFIDDTHSNLAAIDHCTKELREKNEACDLLDEKISEASLKADRSIRIAREHFASRKSARAQLRKADAPDNAALDRESKGDTEALRQLRANATSNLKRLQSAHRQLRDRVAWLKQARRDHTARLKERFHEYHPSTRPTEQLTALETLCQHAAVFGYRLLAISFPRTQWSVQEALYKQLDEQGRLDALVCGLQYARHRTVPFGARLNTEMVIHEDNDLLVVNKPPGLLSAPGRHWTTADNLVCRLSHYTVSAHAPMLIHRLDQETSGVMVLAKNRDIHKQLSQQFMERNVKKSYRACVKSAPSQPSGTIKLPLAAVRSGRPHQVVDCERGKPALTQYTYLQESSIGHLVHLEPTTGRTHQLRVHCAAPEGLGAPILGDELYGQRAFGQRLYLHAESLSFRHPRSQQTLLLAVDAHFV